MKQTAFRRVGVLALVAAAVGIAATAGLPGRATAEGPRGPNVADGRYQNVQVEGRVVPLIHVKDNGTVVLVDTTGATPHRWNEQFRRKGDAPAGTYNVHKSSPEGTESFADLPVDRRGLWSFDESGNLVAR